MRKAAPGSECSSLVSPGLGSPFAMTSILLSSFLMVSVLRSRRKTFVETVAPASRQIRATARSRAAPLDLKVPDRGQAARWSPKVSKGCWRRHLAGVCGRGRRRRLSKRTRKWALRARRAQFFMTCKALQALMTIIASPLLPSWTFAAKWHRGVNESNSYAFTVMIWKNE